MKQNFLKLGLALIAIMTFSLGNAQQTTGDVTKTEDLSQSSVLNGTIRVIDNKGTKKFLQVKNGLTLLTDTAPDGGIVSTWQLGGTLTDATNIATGTNEFKITLDAGGTFVLDGVLQETGIAATAGTIGTSGYTILVRDEATGETRKILATDLVKSGHITYATTADGITPALIAALTDVSIPLAYEKVWVYRNGAKLVANTDYTIGAGGIIALVTTAAAPNDWAIYNGDVFEVHWIN